eukprot:2260573-Prymnesium_polylepis.1
MGEGVGKSSRWSLEKCMDQKAQPCTALPRRKELPSPSTFSGGGSAGAVRWRTEEKIVMSVRVFDALKPYVQPILKAWSDGGCGAGDGTVLTQENGYSCTLYLKSGDPDRRNKRETIEN